MNAVTKMRCQGMLEHFCALCQVGAYIVDKSDKSLSPCGEDFCSRCGLCGGEAGAVHSFGSGEAARWGGKYIYYCPLGLAFAAISPEGLEKSGVVAGPMVLVELPEQLAFAPAAVIKSAEGLKIRSAQELNHICEVLQAAVGGVCQPLKEFPARLKAVEYGKNLENVRHYDAIYRTIDYIKVNYSDKLTLEELAANVGLSRTYLSGVFRKEVGMSLFSYITRFRVEVGKMLLLDTKLDIVDIAAECGFPDQSYFTRVFRSATGVSPKTYRNSRGNIGK